MGILVSFKALYRKINWANGLISEKGRKSTKFQESQRLTKKSMLTRESQSLTKFSQKVDFAVWINAVRENSARNYFYRQDSML